MILTNALVWTGEAGVPAAPGKVHLRDGRIAEAADGPVIDLGGRIVTPALIDCHTHLVHGGDRAAEWALRVEGAGYEAIARAGGGILSTVRATRGESQETLIASADRRLAALAADGVATVEIKSGYGLDMETELRMLRAARALDGRHGVQVVTTLLAAHALPPDYRCRGAAYIAEVAVPTLRAAHAEGLADAVDAFCEGIAFSADEIAPLFAEARALGLPVKLHAEQLGHSGGVALAAGQGALSADHLEHATAADAALMAAAGTVAVLLPGAFYVLRETARPPVAAFRAHAVPMAVATDMNPGTSPLLSLRLALHMACTLFGLTVEEAMLGATAHAARALGLSDRGRIAPGLRADLTVWDSGSLAGIIGTIAGPPPYLRITNGEIRHA